MLPLSWIVIILLVLVLFPSSICSTNWTAQAGSRTKITEDEASSGSAKKSSLFSSHLTPWYLSQNFDISLKPFVQTLSSTENDRYEAVHRPSDDPKDQKESVSVPSVITQRHTRALNEEGFLSSLTGKRQPNPPRLNKNPNDEDIRQLKEEPSSYLFGSSDTLDALLHFLRVSGSPVDGLLELRSLLLMQKQEKITLTSLVDEMRVNLQGIRYQLRLQSEEIQVHAEEITHLKMALDLETSRRSKLEVLFQLQSFQRKRDHSLVAPQVEDRSDQRGNDEIRAHQYTRNNSRKWNSSSSGDSQFQQATLDYDPNKPSILDNLQNEGDRKAREKSRDKSRATRAAAAKRTQSDVFRGLKLLPTLLRAPTSFETPPARREHERSLVQSTVTNHSIGNKTSRTDRANPTKRKTQTMVSQLKSLVHTLDHELRSAVHVIWGPRNSTGRPETDLLDGLFEDMKTTVVHVIRALQNPRFRLLNRPRELALLEKIFLEFQMRARTLLTRKGKPVSNHGSRNELDGAFQRLMEVTVELIVDLRGDVNRLHEGQLKQARDLASLKRAQSAWRDTSSTSLAIKVDHLQRMVNERLPEVLGLMAQMLSKDLEAKESILSLTNEAGERRRNASLGHQRLHSMRENARQGFIPSYLVDESDLVKINIARRQVDKKINQVQEIARQTSGKEVKQRKELNQIINGLRRLSGAIESKTQALGEAWPRRQTQKKSSLFSSSHPIQKRIGLGSQDDKKARFDPARAQLLSSSVRNESPRSSLAPEAHELNDRIPPTLLQLVVALSKLRDVESKSRRNTTVTNDKPTRRELMNRLEHFEYDLRALESRFDIVERQTRKGSASSSTVSPTSFTSDISGGSSFIRHFTPSGNRFKYWEKRLRKLEDNCAQCADIRVSIPNASHGELENGLHNISSLDLFQEQLARSSSKRPETKLMETLNERVKWLAKGQNLLKEKMNALPQQPYSQVVSGRMFDSTPNSLASKERPEMMKQVIEVLGSMDSALDVYQKKLKTLIDSTPSELLLATFEQKLDHRNKEEQRFRRDVLFVLSEFEREITLIKTYLINSTKTFPINVTHGSTAHLQSHPGNERKASEDESEMTKLRRDVNKLKDLLLPKSNHRPINPSWSPVFPSNDTALSQGKTTRIYLLLAKLHLDLDAIRLDLKRQTSVSETKSILHLNQRVDRVEETIRSVIPLFQTMKNLSWHNYLTRKMASQNDRKQKIFLHNWWGSLRDISGILEVALGDHLQLRNHVGRIQSFSSSFQDIKTSLNVISQKVQTLLVGLDAVLPGSTNHARSPESRTFGQPRVAPSSTVKKKLLGLSESIGALHSRVDRLPPVRTANQIGLAGMRREIAKLKNQVNQFLPLSKYIDDIGPLRGLGKPKLDKLKGIMLSVKDVSKALVRAFEDVERLETVDRKILRLSANDILRLTRELHSNLVQIRRNSQRNTMLYMGARTYYDDRMERFERKLRSLTNGLGPLKRALDEKISSQFLSALMIERLRQELIETARAMNESQTTDNPAQGVLGPKLHALGRLINQVRRTLHERQMGQGSSWYHAHFQHIEEDLSNLERKQKMLEASFAKLSNVLATLVDHFPSGKSQLDDPVPSNLERRLRSLEQQTRRLASKLSLTTNPSSLPNSRSKNGRESQSQWLAHKFQSLRDVLAERYGRNLVAKLFNGLETKPSFGFESKHKLQLPREMPHITTLHELGSWRKVLKHLARQRNDILVRELSTIHEGLNVLSDQVKRMRTTSPGNANQVRGEPELEQILRHGLTEFHHILEHLRDSQRKEWGRHVRLIPADLAEAKFEDEQIKHVSPGVSKSMAERFDALIDNFLRSMNESRHKMAEIIQRTNYDRADHLAHLHKYVDDVVESALALKRSKALQEYQEVSSQLMMRLEAEINGVRRNRDQDPSSALKLLLGHDFALRQLMDYILMVARKVAAKGSDVGHGHFLSDNLMARRPVPAQTKEDIRQIRRLLERMKIRGVLQTHQSLMDSTSSQNLSHTLTRLEDRLQAALDLGRIEKDSRSMTLMELRTVLNKGETLKADLESLLKKARVAQKVQPRLFVETHKTHKSNRAETNTFPSNLSDEPIWTFNGFQRHPSQSQRWDLLDPALDPPLQAQTQPQIQSRPWSNASFQEAGPQFCCPSLWAQIQEQQSKLVLVELNLNQSLMAQAELHHLFRDLTTEIRKDFVKKIDATGWISVIQGNWLNIRQLNQSFSQHILQMAPFNQMWSSGVDSGNHPQLQHYLPNLMFPARSQGLSKEGMRMLLNPLMNLKPDCSSKGEGFQNIILSTGRPLRVLCKHHGVVIQNRPGPQNAIKFQKSWNQFVTGFGKVEDDSGFWLGLETLHYLSNPPGTLSIDLWLKSGREFHITCKNFSIGDQDDDFIIKSVQCLGNLDSSETSFPSSFLSSGRRFATFDHFSNISYTRECSKQIKGGWWFPADQCQVVNPNMDDLATGQAGPLDGHQNVIRRSRMVFQPEMGSHPFPNEILLMNNHPQSSEFLRYPSLPNMRAMGTSNAITQPAASSSASFPASVMFPGLSSSSSSSSSSSVLFPGYLGTGMPTIQLNNINVFPKSLDGSSNKQPMEHGDQRQTSQEKDDEHLSYQGSHQSFYSMVTPPNQHDEDQ